MLDKTIGIVGSGIAGLMCGQLLQQAGHSVFLIDKGRRAGGRMSTRIRGANQWDHGAQYFTVRDNEFAQHVKAWKESGVVSKWFDLFPHQAPEKKEERYIGINGMNAIPQHASIGLKIHQSLCVDKLDYQDKSWQLIMESGEVFSCQELVLTPPLPQVVDLLNKSNLLDKISESAPLESVKYNKGLSLMLVLKSPSAIPSPGCLKFESEKVSWIADNSQKKGFPDQYCVTVQATPKYADYGWDKGDNEVAHAMIESIQELLGSEVIDWHIHRWLYAFAKNPLKSKFYRDANMNLSIAGDAFLSSRVESAAVSGLSTAEALIKSLK